jgi:hypothetical protein
MLKSFYFQFEGPRLTRSLESHPMRPPSDGLSCHRFPAPDFRGYRRGLAVPKPLYFVLVNPSMLLIGLMPNIHVHLHLSLSPSTSRQPPLWCSMTTRLHPCGRRRYNTYHFSCCYRHTYYSCRAPYMYMLDWEWLQPLYLGLALRT